MRQDSLLSVVFVNVCECLRPPVFRNDTILFLEVAIPFRRGRRLCAPSLRNNVTVHCIPDGCQIYPRTWFIHMETIDDSVSRKLARSE